MAEVIGLELALLEAPEVHDGSVRCTCGERLLDAIDERHVTIEGRTFPFRRTSDHLVCAACNTSYPVALVRESVALAA
jgi:hypothetical protein